MSAVYGTAAERRAYETGARDGLRNAIEALDELPGTSATGYYASGDQAGYAEATADMERILTARLAGGAR